MNYFNTVVMSIERNFITIQGWMITGLNLSGNNLLTFALIFGFCQDEETEFKGSINYVCKWLNCSRPTAIKALNSLVESNLIKKRKEVVSGVTFNRYSINLQVVKKLYLGSKESLQGGGKETLLGGSKETLPNNIFLDTIIEDRDRDIEEKENKYYRVIKHLKLSFEEFEKLKDLGYSVKQIDDILDAVENYKNNKNYVSLFLTSKKWLEKEYPKKEETKKVFKVN